MHSDHFLMHYLPKPPVSPSQALQLQAVPAPGRPPPGTDVGGGFIMPTPLLPDRPPPGYNVGGGFIMPTPLVPGRLPPGTDMGGGFLMPTPMPVMCVPPHAGPIAPHPQASSSNQHGTQQYGDQFGGQNGAQQHGQYFRAPQMPAVQGQSYGISMGPNAYPPAANAHPAPASASVSSGAAAYMQLMGMLRPGGPKPVS